MTAHQFIQSHQPQWKELEAFIQRCNRLSLARVPLEEFRQGSRLYRQSVSDLAYVRMRFPRHAVVRELERLVGLAHSVIYQARRSKSTDWFGFWLRTWPALVRGAAGHIALAAAIFWAAAGLGLVLAAYNPILESYFISDPMRQAMNNGQLWTQSITAVAPLASSAIAQNNISVSLLAWALGLTFGVGTTLLVTFNGLMLGVVSAACLRAGLFGALAEFVVGHGALELPAIWIAAGAGLVMAEAMVFPGRYSRRVEIRLAARRSVQIVVGVIPMLLIAALVEGFVSPSSLPPILKVLVGAALALAYVAYILTAPKEPQATNPRRAA